MPKQILNDYLTICKPRVVLLMLATAWVGMYMANPQEYNWQVYICATIGIACAASSAAIVNHLIDRHIDRKMQRTQYRPIATGRIMPQHALIFAGILASFAWIILSMYVNTLTAILSFITLFAYAIVYTLYLKHATSQNIVIGGLAGAMPPLLGWAAVTGEISALALLLVLIIFVWTPPHFWALAIYRIDDYKSAQIPMLPITHGIKFTKLCLLLYTLLLTAVTCLPFVVGLSGYLYFGTAIILNAVFLSIAWRLYLAPTDKEAKIAIQTFNFSIKYLLLLFAAILIDRIIGANL